jgi:hypothetical protein
MGSPRSAKRRPAAPTVPVSDPAAASFKVVTSVRQPGLGHQVVRLLEIDAKGPDMDVFLSLGDLRRTVFC